MLAVLPDEERVVLAIRREHGPMLEAGGRYLKALVETMTGDPPPAAVTRHGLGHAAAVAFLLGRQIKAFRALHLLCEHGLEFQAWTLGRVLLEGAVVLIWMTESEEDERIDRFLDYYAASMVDLYDTFNRDPSTRAYVNPEREAEWRRLYAERRSASSLRGISTAELLGESLESAASRFGLRDAWAILHKVGSKMIHVDPTDMDRYVQVDESGGLSINLSPGHELLPNIYIRAYLCLHHAVGAASTIVAVLKTNPALRDAEEAVVRWLEEARRSGPSLEGGAPAPPAPGPR